RRDRPRRGADGEERGRDEARRAHGAAVERAAAEAVGVIEPGPGARHVTPPVAVGVDRVCSPVGRVDHRAAVVVEVRTGDGELIAAATLGAYGAAVVVELAV